ncbi:MAG: hypothetical protein ACK6EB_46050, partial [Planctomyces sp.]
MITAVLPFRSVADSKRRMESALSEQERMELSARLLVRTLAALRNALAENPQAPRPEHVARIVYPGYDLRAAEINELKTTLRTFSEKTKLISFEEAFLPPETPARSAARPKV